MDIIVGTILIKKNRILMVKETKEECYGKWAFPAGHLKEKETIFEGAKRETYEETGCKVELEKVFPILVMNEINIIMIHFFAFCIEENLNYKTDEIMDKRWISIEDIKKMKKEEFRNYEIVNRIINSLEKNELYDLQIFKNL